MASQLESNYQTYLSHVLEINSNPNGAYIIIDGIHYGTTPCKVTNCEPGRHDVSIYKPGYNLYSDGIDTSKNERVINIKLCVIGKTECDGSCVDIKTDESNCGSCGNKCPEGMSCEDGNCACPNGKTECDGSCIDIKTDESNCGSCGNKCPDVMSCEDGNCSITLASMLNASDRECTLLSVIYLIIRDLFIVCLLFLCICLSDHAKLLIRNNRAYNSISKIDHYHSLASLFILSIISILEIIKWAYYCLIS